MWIIKHQELNSNPPDVLIQYRDTIQRKWRQAYCTGICRRSKCGNCMWFIGGLVFSASLDKLVLFQFMLGNHMSKMPWLNFLHFWNTVLILSDFLKSMGFLNGEISLWPRGRGFDVRTSVLYGLKSRAMYCYCSTIHIILNKHQEQQTQGETD